MGTGAIWYVFVRPLALEASWIAPRNPLVRQVSQDIGGNTTPDTHWDGWSARGTTTGRLPDTTFFFFFFSFCSRGSLGASWIAPRDPLVRQFRRDSRGNTKCASEVCVVIGIREQKHVGNARVFDEKCLQILRTGGQSSQKPMS